ADLSIPEMKNIPAFAGMFFCEMRGQREERFVGWAKARTAPCPPIIFVMRGIVGTLRFAHPTWLHARSLLRFRKAVVERVAGAAHGADRILLAAGVEQLAQAADVYVHSALIDIDVAAPDAVEQLLARKHPARMFQEELQQAIFGRAEINRAARTRHAALL